MAFVWLMAVLQLASYIANAHCCYLPGRGSCINASRIP